MLTDLHMHSYYSDGTMSPREIVEDAKKRNVQLIAITDHNVLDSYTELTKLMIMIKEKVGGREFIIYLTEV